MEQHISVKLVTYLCSCQKGQISNLLLLDNLDKTCFLSLYISLHPQVKSIVIYKMLKKSVISRQNLEAAFNFCVLLDYLTDTLSCILHVFVLWLQQL